MPAFFRNAIKVSFVFGVTIASYYLSNKLGYLPPVTYFFKQEAKSLNLSPPREQLLNYSQAIALLIPDTYDKPRLKF